MTDLITDIELKQIINYISIKAGIKLQDTLYKTIIDYTNKKLLTLNISFNDYMNILNANPKEFEDFLSEITIGETYFFRDEKQFNILYNSLLQELFNNTKNEIIFWSAACSTGEEPASIAMIANEFLKDYPSKKIFIYGSDINKKIIEQNKNGIFKSGSIRSDGKIFYRLVEKNIEYENVFEIKIKSSIMSFITFVDINLALYDYSSIPDNVSIIFLRNVLIYLETNVRDNIINNIVKKLHVNGYLFLASTEIILFKHPELEILNIDNIYFFKKIELKKVEPNKSIHIVESNYKKKSEKKIIQKLVNKSEKIETQNDIEIISILFTTNQVFLKKPLYKKNENLIKQCNDYLEFMELLNNHKRENALKIIDDLDDTYQSNALSIYLRGYYYVCEGNTKKAVNLLTESLNLHSSFWPARYHRAILETTNNTENARRDFVMTLKHIEEYISLKQEYYDFLLEGFNARYFLTICEKWLKKLSLTGAYNGN